MACAIRAPAVCGTMAAINFARFLSDDHSPQQQRDELTARERFRAGGDGGGRRCGAPGRVRQVVDMELDDALAFVADRVDEARICVRCAPRSICVGE